MEARSAKFGRCHNGGAYAGIRCLGRRKQCGRSSLEYSRGRAGPHARAEEEGEEGQGREAGSGRCGERSGTGIIITAYPRRRPIRRFPTGTAACAARGSAVRVLHADDADGAGSGLAPTREGTGRVHVMLAVFAAGAGAGLAWEGFGGACAVRAEHHCRAERVEGRAWGWGRRTFGEPGGVALARGRDGGLLVRGCGASQFNVDVVGAAYALTGAVVVVIVDVVVVVMVVALLSAWVGWGKRVIRGRG